MPDLSNWIDVRPVPLDHHGPADRPFLPLPHDLSDQLGLRPIERIASLYPDKIAIDDGRLQLTYAEVMDRAYGLAARIDASVPPGGVVASLIGTSAAAPIVVMACVASARTLVPIDAGHPVDRQRALFNESGAQALLVETGAAIDDSFVHAALPRLVVNPSEATGVPRFAAPIDPEAPMLVIFTSGSTGRPKGIAFPYRTVRAMAQFVDMFHVNADDVILGIASLSTGGSRDVFSALTTGATIRLLDIKRAGFAEALRVLGSGITLLSFVPTALRMVMNIPGIENAFRTLRALDLHGEGILASDIELFRQKLPADCRISITFGATETGLIFSWFVDEALVDGAICPAGYLIPGKQVAIVADDGSFALPGDPGELIVRGAMPLGGWQAGKLTHGSYLQDTDGSGGKIYRTGDLVRHRPDGLFEHLGRRDRRVKIRGLWAELSEIEAALMTMPGVAEAVTVVRQVANDADEIVAFVVAEPGGAVPEEPAMRSTIADATAEHMVPAEFRVLDQMPRLANFKADLVRLAAMLDG
ncbi:AMP-binding protein [Sphingomonas aerophila]|uniref:Acyl-coenzyme A synthetase/AMP-(Fatty) acid ligase n=1 Tax=Sphingomonas aerophila TaxID=1344948 RepID=A0A7W9EX55_9SPHN|nr:acyl-coenzyme A synthetase/AMP-(fatty) acid ligase [Sphingomonas aerophila]